MEVKTGTAAPDFTLPSHTDQKVSLASFRGRPVVVAYAVPRAVELDERLVHERGRLQRVPGTLPAHERPRNLPQLAVDERQQIVDRGTIAVTQLLQELADKGLIRGAGGRLGAVAI